MRLKIKHFDAKVFESKMQHLKDVDFILFVDDIPQSESELTSLNILVLQEPNEYFGLHDWAIKNKDLCKSKLKAIYVLDITNCMLWRAVVRWKYLQR